MTLKLAEGEHLNSFFLNKEILRGPNCVLQSDEKEIFSRYSLDIFFTVIETNIIQ